MASEVESQSSNGLRFPWPNRIISVRDCSFADLLPQLSAIDRYTKVLPLSSADQLVADDSGRTADGYRLTARAIKDVEGFLPGKRLCSNALRPFLDEGTCDSVAFARRLYGEFVRYYFRSYLSDKYLVVCAKDRTLDGLIRRRVSPCSNFRLVYALQRALPGAIAHSFYLTGRWLWLRAGTPDRLGQFDRFVWTRACDIVNSETGNLYADMRIGGLCRSDDFAIWEEPSILRWSSLSVGFERLIRLWRKAATNHFPWPALATGLQRLRLMPLNLAGNVRVAGIKTLLGRLPFLGNLAEQAHRITPLLLSRGFSDAASTEVIQTAEEEIRSRTHLDLLFSVLRASAASGMQHQRRIWETLACGYVKETGSGLH